MSSGSLLEAAAEEVQRAERLMRAVFSGASDAMLLMNDDGLYVDVNPAACALFQASRGTLLRRRVGSYAEVEAHSLEAFRTMLESGHASGRLTIVRADGERRTLAYALTANIGAHLHLSVLRDITDEEQAAESLARSEAELRRTDVRFRAMIEKSAEGVLLLSGDGRVLFATHHASDILKVPLDEVLGSKALTWVLPEDQTRFTEGLTSVAPRESTAFEFRVKDGDGDERWLEAAATNMVDDPDVRALIVNVRDVSERQRAERERERLVESLTFERLRLGTLLQTAPAFMVLLRGPRHIAELANDAFRTIVGDRALIGLPVADTIPDIATEEMLGILDGVLQAGKPFSAKAQPLVVRQTPDGEPESRFVNVVIQPVCEADGSRSGVFVHGIDVTEETIARDRVRAQFNGMPIPTYAWRRVMTNGVKDFVLLDYNDAAFRITGGGIARLLGATATEVFRGEDDIIADLERCLVDGRPFEREVDRQMASIDLRKRFLVTYSRAAPDVVLAHTEDVTERWKLEEHLRQAQKMEAVGRLAGGVAHDFNNLLSIVLSYTSLAMDDLPTGHPLRADLAEVNRAGRRAVELTRQLLAFSRQQVLQPRVMAISESLAALEKMLRRLLREDVELVLLPRSTACVHADPGQMEQVIMNLVINARDAMPEGGVLTVVTEEVHLSERLESDPVATPPGDYVVLSVTDTGTGMHEETRAKIFEPFFTTKGPGKGTGLGLATVFGIVQQTGGTIRVETRFGHGTTFRLYFPMTMQTSAAQSIPPPPAAKSVGHETILVVEDEAPLRVLVVKVLRAAGYEVLEAGDGEAALALADGYARPIDLLLTDVVMPRMNGRVLADRLRQARPKIRVLLMSGYTDDAAVIDRVLDSQVEFVQKPIMPTLLLDRVREVLDALDPDE